MTRSYLGKTVNVRTIGVLALALAVFTAASTPALAGKGKDELPALKDVAKDHEASEGFINLYYKQKSDHLLGEIPKQMLGQNFLMALSIAAGGSQTGFQAGDELVQWRQMDKQLVLVRPDVRYVQGKNSTVEDVVERTYREDIITAVPIVATNNGNPVIDLDNLLKSGSLGFGGNVNSAISRWVKRKVFKDNVELEVDLAVMSGRYGGKPIRVHYSISRLPQSNYQPRKADDRIGYFLTVRKDWSVDHDAETLFDRYINRWHVRKSEPKEKVSDVHPDDQIVFYIEKTVPVKYRRFVREGILEWNKAFENAGIRNAIQVRQQTDSNEFADLDPEDVNYNFFRWIVSGRAFAMGPSRANPLTGEILDADIIMDDSMARVWSGRYDRLKAKADTAQNDPMLQAFLEANPSFEFSTPSESWTPDEFLTTEEPIWEPLEFGIPEAFSRHSQGSHCCSFANGVAHEMALTEAFMRATAAPENRDEYVGQWIRLVTTHEVGHTLGLRHNFKGSAWKSLDEILANEDPETPTTASVMDYNPAVYNLDRTPRHVYVSQSVGPYDNLAIEYGYRVPLPGEDEPEMLDKIAKRLAEEGLDFATDEDTSFLGPDPLVNRYDYSDDPVAYARYRMRLVKSLMDDILGWSVKDGESYDKTRRQFDMLLSELSRSTQYATRVVGGQYFHRFHKGDAEGVLPIEIVPAKVQRDALEFLAEYVFADQPYRVAPDVIRHLAPGRWQHWGSDDFDYWQEYPYHDEVASVQYWALLHTMNPRTISRIYDAELKFSNGEDRFTAAELIESLAGTIWTEVHSPDADADHTAAKPFVSSLRRQLQRRHLDMLTRMVLANRDAYPADAVAIARTTLESLKAEINASLKSVDSMDSFSRAHLTDAVEQISRTLDASYRL